MTDEDRETVYTLLGVRADGVVPVVDLLCASNDVAARRKARGWLAQHTTCQAAEIWRDGVLVGAVTDIN